MSRKKITNGTFCRKYDMKCFDVPYHVRDLFGIEAYTCDLNCVDCEESESFSKFIWKLFTKK